MQPRVLRAPTAVRFIGAWQCVLSTFGFVIAFVGGGAAPVLGPMWGISMLYLGIRNIRLCVICDADSITMRNRVRTTSIPWGDVESIARADRQRYGFGMKKSAAGRVMTVYGTGCFIDATETSEGHLVGTVFALTEDEATIRIATLNRYHDKLRSLTPRPETTLGQS